VVDARQIALLEELHRKVRQATPFLSFAFLPSLFFACFIPQRSNVQTTQVEDMCEVEVLLEILAQCWLP